MYQIKIWVKFPAKLDYKDFKGSFSYKIYSYCYFYIYFYVRNISRSSKKPWLDAY